MAGGRRAQVSLTTSRAEDDDSPALGRVPVADQVDHGGIRMRRFTSAAVSLAVVLAIAGSASAQPKKGGGGDDMEFAPDEAKGGPPSKTLERAKKLYDKGDYYSASIELAKVVHGETDDSDANKQNAQFFMGKTLYQMGYYAASLATFDEIVKAGPAHVYHSPTLKWLAALSRVLPETSDILDKIGTYDPA